MSTLSKVIGNVALKLLISKLRYCEKHGLQNNEGEQQTVSLYTSTYIAACHQSSNKFDTPMSADLLLSYMLKGLRNNAPTAESIEPVAMVLDLDAELCLIQATEAHLNDLATLEQDSLTIPRLVKEEIEDFTGDASLNAYQYLPQVDYDVFTGKLTQAVTKEIAAAVTRYFKFKQADILADVMLLKAFKPEPIVA